MVKRPSSRARIAQWLLLLALAAVGWQLWVNVAGNLALRHMNFSFAFLTGTANFDIPFHLIDWHVGDTYTRALLVCTLNTLLVSAAGIVAATLLGLLVGIMRLSDNWLVRNVALAFIELRTYAAGDKAVAQHLAHKHGGRIDRDRVVIAWDAD